MSGREPEFVEALRRRLSERFGDEHLTTAAQHVAGGPPQSERPTLEVKKILAEFEALRKPSRGGTSARASSATDARSVLLFVHALLVRGEAPTMPSALLEWSEEFPGAPAGMPDDSAPTEMGDAATLEHASQLAAEWGLWQEHDLLDDLALLRRAPQDFARALRFVLDARSLTENGGLMLSALQERMPEGDELLRSARWDWRHVASVARRLRYLRELPARANAIRQHAGMAGFVVIPCATVDDCYAALQRLHGRFEHRAKAIRDHVGRHARSGYQALHTELAVPYKTSQAEPVTLGTSPVHLLKVKLVPGKAFAERHIFADRSYLARSAGADALLGGIKVYTPAGDPKKLARDATVINFAVAVHRDFVTRLRAAVVNGERKIDLFHRLEEGDQVELELYEEHRPLPLGWEERVPAETVPMVRHAQRKSLENSVFDQGRRWIRARLKDQDLKDDLDDDVLDLLLEDAGIASQYAMAGQAPRSFRWWLQAIGRLAGARRSDAAEEETVVHEREALALVGLMKDRFAAMSRLTYELPDEESSLPIKRCPRCNPSEEVTVAAVRDGASIMLHVASSSCAAGMEVLRSLRRVLVSKFFVVETSNRAGLASEVLAVFGQHDIDLIEIVGYRLTPSLGIMRVEADRVGELRAAVICKELEVIGGVLSVTFGDRNEVTPIEANLPPRRETLTSNAPQPTPYHCGGEVDDDRHFYGRDDELKTLHRLVGEARPEAERAGRMVLVEGPLKIGKSSLVKKFVRELHHRRDRPIIVAGLTPSRPDRWTNVARNLRSILLRQLDAVGKQWSHHERPPEGATLAELLTAIPALPWRPGVVLIVDEAIELFHEIDGDEAESDELVRFCRRAQDSSNVLVVWVGTTAPVKRLSAPFQKVIRGVRRLHIPPFNENEVIDLLRARKLGTMHDIKVSPGVAQEVFRQTAGGPYLVTSVANELWRRRRPESTGAVVYTLKDVALACTEVIEEGIALQQLLPEQWARTQVRKVLLAMVCSPSDVQRARSVVGVKKKHLEHECGTDPTAILDELLDMGAVEPCPDGRYGIAAAMLERFILDRASEASVSPGEP